MKRFLSAVSRIGKIPIAVYKGGSTLVILALAGIYFLCESEVSAGGVGVEFYYAPMLDCILMTFIIFWAGTLLLDLVDKDAQKRKDT